MVTVWTLSPLHVTFFFLNETQMQRTWLTWLHPGDVRLEGETPLWLMVWETPLKQDHSLLRNTFQSSVQIGRQYILFHPERGFSRQDFQNLPRVQQYNTFRFSSRSLPFPRWSFLARAVLTWHSFSHLGWEDSQLQINFQNAVSSVFWWT